MTIAADVAQNLLRWSWLDDALALREQWTGWLPYFFALLAIGLLPFKTSSRGAPFALAVLWSLRPGHLAVFEAILLLVLGTIFGRLELTVRSGPWAVAGTVLILYTMVPPLLGNLGLSLFQSPAWSLSPWLLTCGVLFFSAGKTTHLAAILALPMTLVLCGGSPDVTDSTALWGLRATLLMGALFLTTPHELRTASDHPVPAGTAYFYAYRRRSPLSYGLWALALLTALVLFLALGAWSGHDEPGLWRMPVNLFLLSALGIAVWLTFPAWQTLWFRTAAWNVTRAAGNLWVGIAAAWRWGIFLLAAGVLAYWCMRRNISLDHIPSYLFLVLLLLWLAFQAFRARRRLVIGSFTDHTGGAEKPQAWVTGLGSRLQSELARISDLLKVIDAARPPQKSGFIEVGAEVLDVGEILKSTSNLSIGPLQIPLSFVAEIVNRLVNGPRLTGALYKVDDEYILTAEISGGGCEGNWRVDFSKLSPSDRRPAQAAVHKLVEQLAYRVTAKLVSIGSPRWRAVRFFTDGLRAYRETQQRKSSVAPLLRKAESCLIQALGDDQRFAQCHYNLGVVYKQLNELHSAEAAFRRALSENPQSFVACYALAETFCQLKDYVPTIWFCDAAITIRPRDARAWDLKAYAQRRYEEEKAGKHSGPNAVTLLSKTWQPIVEMREIAVALSWRALCGRALRGQSPALDESKNVAYFCARNLGVVLTYVQCVPDTSAWANRLFRQAESIASRPELTLNIGRAHYRSQAWSQAYDALHGVFADGLEPREKGLLWSVVARLDASTELGSPDRDKARLAHQRFLDLIASTDPENLDVICRYGLEEPTTGQSQSETSQTETLQVRDRGWNSEWYRQRLKRLCSVLQKLDQSPKSELNDFARLQGALRQKRREEAARAARIKRLEKYLEHPDFLNRFLAQEFEEAKAAQQDWQSCLDDCKSDMEWIKCQIRIKLAQSYQMEEPDSPDHLKMADKAVDHLALAIRSLEKRKSRQVREQGLYALLAKGHMVLAKAKSIPPAKYTRLLQMALIEAKESVELEPESARERLVLIEAFSRIGDFEGMQVDAEIALQLDPGPETLQTIGGVYWRHIVSLNRRGARRKILREAVCFFRRALKDVESGPLDLTGAVKQVEAHGWAHFWLGRFLLESGRYDEATANLRTACELGFKPLESRVEMAWAYLLAHNVPQAETAFFSALREAADPQQSATVAWGAGEERPIAELIFDTFLGWAQLAATLDADEATKRLTQAERCLQSFSEEFKKDKKGALDEIRARIQLLRKETSAAVEALEKVARWGARPGAWCALARVALEEVQAGGAGAPAARCRAREAFQQARETDIRGRHGREILELRRALRQAEKATEGKAAAPAPKPPAPATAPVTPPPASS